MENHHPVTPLGYREEKTISVYWRGFHMHHGRWRSGAIHGGLVVLLCLGLLLGGSVVWYLSRSTGSRPLASRSPGSPSTTTGRSEQSGPEPAPRALPPARPDVPTGSLRATEARDWPVRMTDVTEATGITFRHTDGSSGKRYVIESMTGGVALFDYDQDGDLDIYFLNGAPLKGTDVAVAPTNALYRNDGNWQFTDVTAQAGVGDVGYGLGVCVGDYDNDGDPDLYVNNYGPNVLYENRGGGVFADVTEAAGVANGERVGAGASFFDMDADGDLDLYSANYIEFSYEEHRPHRRRGLPAYPSPMSYQPDPDTLYRNNGDRTFTDVSVESGVAAHAGTGMGVVCSDYDNDRDLDVFVANDQRANFLFRNDGSGRFEEVGLLSGAAVDFGGHPQATMGVDAGDFNNDGSIDFHTTSFAGEWATLYENAGSGGMFVDATRRTDAGAGTFPHVTWGNAFADFDNDGYRDLFIACGHLDDNLSQRGGDDTTAYSVANVLLRNLGGERFVDVSRYSGEGMGVALSSRGVAVGDLDNDGDEDVVVTNSRREPTILRNDSTADHHWIKLRLQGTRSNRSGLGARVTVVAGDLVQTSELHSGRGYQSHFGDPLHFGLGTQQQIDKIEIDWLGGGRDVLKNPPLDQIQTVTQGNAEAGDEPPEP